MLPLQCDAGDYTRVARLRHDFMPDITALIFLHFQDDKNESILLELSHSAHVMNARNSTAVALQYIHAPDEYDCGNTGSV